jgi:hypothetical protein
MQVELHAPRTAAGSHMGIWPFSAREYMHIAHTELFFRWLEDAKRSFYLFLYLSCIRTAKRNFVAAKWPKQLGSRTFIRFRVQYFTCGLLSPSMNRHNRSSIDFIFQGRKGEESLCVYNHVCAGEGSGG